MTETKTEIVRTFGSVLGYSLSAFSIVFLSLFVIIVVIKLFLLLDAKWEERVQKRAGLRMDKQQDIDNITLILITASVTAYLKSKVRIGRIRRISSATRHGGTWAEAGRITLLGSHNIIHKRD